MAARRQVGSNQHVERWGADVPEVVEARVSAVSGGWVRQSDPLPRLSLSASQWSMSAVIHPGARAELDVNAPYQRGSVWVPEQQVALIKSTLMKLPTGSILRAQRPAGTVGAFYRIVDGKQRLEALWAFVDRHRSCLQVFAAATGSRALASNKETASSSENPDHLSHNPTSTAQETLEWPTSTKA